MGYERHFVSLVSHIRKVSVAAIGDTMQGVSSVEGTLFCINENPAIVAGFKRGFADEQN